MKKQRTTPNYVPRPMPGALEMTGPSPEVRAQLIAEGVWKGDPISKQAAGTAEAAGDGTARTAELRDSQQPEKLPASVSQGAPTMSMNAPASLEIMASEKHSPRHSLPARGASKTICGSAPEATHRRPQQDPSERQAARRNPRPESSEGPTRETSTGPSLRRPAGRPRSEKTFVRRTIRLTAAVDNDLRTLAALLGVDLKSALSAAIVERLSYHLLARRQAS